jgi:uncharacterized membrane-anchored protein
LPLAVSTSLFAAALIATFAVWYAKEKTLSIHTIVTARRESFYWLAILFTFALGTAAGDWVAEGLKLGYANSGMLLGALIAATTAAWAIFQANAIATFWIAYVLTRPFGASFGDFLAQPVGNGGLGLGNVGTSLTFLLAIVGLVAYLHTADKRLARA